ncbi:MAG: aminotransferase class I/II-fold pyridoxal phosphate-dependent enzyme, partial [Oscillospiraceae bacterium]|nr:aminotransferase class I/II-fold pyridoxal phosphate-dependent enzyme [Oscillospiraceae bacterium]
MQKLSKKTEGFTDSVIRRMTRIAHKYDSINLSQGFPDFAPPEMLMNRLRETADISGVHQYSITFGARDLRHALAEKQSRFMGIDIDPETEITITCGSTEAMMSSVLTVADPGDKVIIFSPFYENYGADTILSGAEPIYVPLVPPDFHFDPEVLEEKSG